MTRPDPPPELVEKYGHKIAVLLVDPSGADPYDFDPMALGDLYGLWLAVHGRRDDEALPVILAEDDLPDAQRRWLEGFLTLYRAAWDADDERRRRERMCVKKTD